MKTTDWEYSDGLKEKLKSQKEEYRNEILDEVKRKLPLCDTQEELDYKVIVFKTIESLKLKDTN